MSYEYEPENLDSAFIDEIYEEALTDKKHVHVPVEVLGPHLVKNRTGEVILNMDAIEKYSEYIDYMFGQIRAFHDTSKRYMAFQEGYIDYMNGYWTEDTDTILKFYAIGIANGSILPFDRSKNGILVAPKDSFVIPTLNTEDPRFPEWFENVYKKKYELRKNIGRPLS